MSSQHRHRPVSFRPEEAEISAARDALAARGRRLGDLLRAALRAYAADPDGVEAVLAPHWPPPRPQGRPRREP